MHSPIKVKGFTLAELLIALGLLGLIAALTIPKVLQAQQNNRDIANAKETADTMSSAYQQLQTLRLESTSTTLGALKPYLNYVKIYTGSIDDAYTDTSFSCNSGNYECLKLHNGGVVGYRANVSFGGSASTNALPFFFDPDGQVTDGTTNGPGKSLPLFIYYSGRMLDRSGVLLGTTNSLGTSYGPAAGKIPPWFTWR